MGDPARVAARAVTCPHCGAAVAGDATELGTFFACRSCATEWVEGLPLDFRTD